MPLKKSKGNMYDWTTHTHAHLGGECNHKCLYCYMSHPKYGRAEKFSGPIRLLEEEFSVQYGIGKTIFIENCNDLFANDVPCTYIYRILEHCRNWPNNTYVFQTKNPERYIEWTGLYPKNSVFGITVETNRNVEGLSNAPIPGKRIEEFLHFLCLQQRVCVDCWLAGAFITVEPIIDFDVNEFSEMLCEFKGLKSFFVNIGADSKGHGLDEPTHEKVMALYEILVANGIEVRKKINIERLLTKLDKK